MLTPLACVRFAVLFAVLWPMPVLYCKRSASAGCLRSLSSFVSSPLRSSFSRPSTLDHAEAPSGRLATDSRSITTCIGSAGSSEVRFRFMDATAQDLRQGKDPCLNRALELARAVATLQK